MSASDRGTPPFPPDPPGDPLARLAARLERRVREIGALRSMSAHVTICLDGPAQLRLFSRFDAQAAREGLTIDELDVDSDADRARIRDWSRDRARERGLPEPDWNESNGFRRTIVDEPDPVPLLSGRLECVRRRFPDRRIVELSVLSERIDRHGVESRVLSVVVEGPTLAPAATTPVVLASSGGDPTRLRREEAFWDAADRWAEGEARRLGATFTRAQGGD